MPQYNGHKSWNAWNVSLWINNDEGLYRQAQDCVRCCSTKRDAARMFLSDLDETTTPDGAPWSITNIMIAMRDL